MLQWFHILIVQHYRFFLATDLDNTKMFPTVAKTFRLMVQPGLVNHVFKTS